MAKKILIVDDEAQMVEMLKLRLRANGYDIITAYDGQEALDKAWKEAPDLIVLDVMMPKIDGYKVCGLLKQDTRYAKMKIVMLTARTQDQDKSMGQDVGVDAFLIKPFEPADLLGKIKELLGE